MITNEKFAEVLKSLTKEDFDAAQELISNLADKFGDLSLREMFTENEIKKISNFLESYSDETLITTIVYKFKEELCLQQP